jgi:hypothetical protein
MTKERRAFLLQFIKMGFKNTQLKDLEKDILNYLSTDFVTTEMEKETIIKKIEERFYILENFFLTYSELVKYQYFNYGLLANDIENNYKDITPVGLIEVLPLEDY